MQIHRFNAIKTILRPANLKILYALKSEKRRWSELEKLMNKRQVSDALNELIDMGLVQTDEQRRGLQVYKLYNLTPLGLTALEKLQELEEVLTQEPLNQED
jgi:DNA-binding HxlR family transcriptional regulator